MKKIAFKMQLHPGWEMEYKKRHDEIWPELGALLKEKGISDYSIFLDEKSYSLFGVMQIEDPSILESLAKEPIMKRWWDYMSDCMTVNMDNSPISTPLHEVFYMS